VRTALAAGHSIFSLVSGVLRGVEEHAHVAAFPRYRILLDLSALFESFGHVFLQSVSGRYYRHSAKAVCWISPTTEITVHLTCHRP